MSRTEYAGGPVPRYLLLAAALFLTAFGLTMVYSASSISALVKEGSATHYFIRQVAFVLVGMGLAYVASRYDYRRFQGVFGKRLWYGAVALLIVTYGLGVVRGGARRWIPLGFVNLQPSEFAKIACVLVAAALAIEWQRGRLETRDYMLQILIYVGIPAALIVGQPDLGTAILLAVGVGVVLFLSGIPMRWIAGAVAALGAFGVAAIMLESYRIQRVLTSLNPWLDPSDKGYQTIQALLAFGTGGLKGVGLGLSRQKFFYLPEAHTDFIFAIIGEEVGLLGTLLIVTGFIILLYAGIRIAMGARDPFGRLVAGALTGMLAFQAVLNMAAVTAVFPVTGKPLPFVSYGGSSMFVTMLSVGLILSVSRYGAHAPRAVRSAPRREERDRASVDERRRNSGARLPRAQRGGPARRRA
ncbi:MAG: putative lipid II flippase FtsW [Coriobacteriia bacterium]|nr:putative lipid II flippase FtsW [Coriobacteriia bacterium]